MKGAHSAKKKTGKTGSSSKPAKSAKTAKKVRKSGVVLKVDPEIIKATMTPKPVQEEKPQKSEPAKSKESRRREPKGKHQKRGGNKPVGVILLAIVAVILVGVAVAFATDAIEFPKGSSTPGGAQPVVVSNDGSATEGDERDQSADETLETGADGDMEDIVETPSEYVNRRFGFTVRIPDEFIIDSEFDNGDGVLLVNGALNMVVQVSGSNNVDDLTAQQIMESLWNGSDDSIRIAEGDRVIIYQYDDTSEYFYWIYVGSGSINQMKIEYPVKDNNQIDLDTAQILMQGFVPGNINRTH